EETLEGVKFLTISVSPASPPIRCGRKGSLLLIGEGDGPVEAVKRLISSASNGLGTLPAYQRALTESNRVDIAEVWIHTAALWKAAQEGLAPALGEGIFGMVRQAIEALGAHTAEAISYTSGFRAGDYEGKLSVYSTKPFEGALAEFSKSINAPTNRDALAHIPARSTQIASFSIDPRGFAEPFQKFVQAIPPLGFALLVFQGQMGFLATDLFQLPKVDVAMCRVFPPAGGWIPDTIAILPKEGGSKYLRVIEKYAAHKKVEAISVKRGDAEIQLLRLSSPIAGFLQGVPLDEMQKAILEAARISVAYTVVGDDLVLGDSVQAVSRYLSHYSKETPATELPQFAASMKRKPNSAWMWLQGDQSFLAAYNSLTATAELSESVFRPVFDTYGVDPSLFPAGDVFAPAFGAGWVEWEAGPKRITVSTHGIGTHLASSSLRLALELGTVLPFAAIR
ncbi:MAG: hypothetical protein AAF517_15030, partial [Planctomycetota bacterium]